MVIDALQKNVYTGYLERRKKKMVGGSFVVLQKTQYVVPISFLN